MELINKYTASFISDIFLYSSSFKVLTLLLNKHKYVSSMSIPFSFTLHDGKGKTYAKSDLDNDSAICLANVYTLEYLSPLKKATSVLSLYFCLTAKMLALISQA